MTSPGDFDSRTRYLSEAVGEGYLVMGCTVNQPYAQDQHQTPYRHHNGRSDYLGGPLLENQATLTQRLARAAITKEGSNLESEAKDIAEEMADYVLKNAPKDTGRLSLSGNPWVDSNGVRVWERPPKMGRRIGPDDSGWNDRP